MTPEVAAATTIARQAVEITYLREQVESLSLENTQLRQALDIASERIEQLEQNASDEARNAEADA